MQEVSCLRQERGSPYFLIRAIRVIRGSFVF
jgi:hypothetical protein